MENIDWSLYKGEDNGRGKKGYISFTNCLNENGWTLKSDYIKNSEKVTIVCKNGHTELIKPNTLLTKKHKDCKECRKALKNKVGKPKVIKSNKGISSIDGKLTKRQLEHFQRIDEASIDSKLTSKQLEHFENVDKGFEYKPRRKVATDIKIESNKGFFEIDDRTRFPKNYNVTLGIPMKSVDLKEKLRKSRLLGQISRVDDILEFSKIEKNN